MKLIKSFVIVLLSCTLWGCQQGDSIAAYKLQEGYAFGTEYNIQYFGDIPDLEHSIDSIIQAVNQSMSNYQKDSDISKLNAGDTTVTVDQMFREVFLLAKEIFHRTDGYFDPTVGNLVNAYGFGAQQTGVKLDSVHIDSLMQYVGFEDVHLQKDHIIRRDPHMYIDLNGIAKGYGVDRFGLFLEARGIENYLVDIGGEIRARGTNLKSGRNWRLGIDDPRIGDGAKEIQGIVELKNRSLATSGNYRKYRVDSLSGRRFVHIVDPKSGYMKKQSLLSASVLAQDCATADAYATAFMAMDIEKSIALAKKLKGIDVFFIYDVQGALKTYTSEGFEQSIVE